jgi:hypothetical protein
MKKLYIYIGLCAVAFASCKPNVTSDKPKAGNVNFSKYLAVGGSFTAGEADGSLYLTGQNYSYPNIIAAQIGKVGSYGPFLQPLLPKEAGWPLSKTILDTILNCDGSNAAHTVDYWTARRVDTVGSASSVAFKGPFGNVGVPGIRVADFLIPGYAAQVQTALGPTYARRFFTNFASATPLDEALRAGHTFFTCWLGEHDVWGYAFAGGQGTVGSTAPFPTDITDTMLFRKNYDIIADSLTRIRNKAKGVLINIPDIKSIPFFTAIAYNGLSLTSAQADNYNAIWRSIGSTNINFTVGSNNRYIIADPAAPNGRRHIAAGEYILLTAADSIRCGQWGTLKAIPAQYVLNSTEVANITNYTNYYNQIILNAANRNNLAYLDMKALFTSFEKGISFNGINFNTQYISGSAFSLDGKYMTARGNAVLANYIIDVINYHYRGDGVNLQHADVSTYPGVKYP